MGEDVVITLSDPQAEVFDSEARFRVLIAGRRFGKTTLAAILLLDAAVKRPGLPYWYTAQTFKNARFFAWPIFKQVVPAKWIAYKNESDLIMQLVNGSFIQLVGREEPDNLRGGGLGRIINDEFASNERGDKGLETWEAVLRPMLSDKLGDALFISTPRGYNWGYDFYMRGTDPEFPDWASWQFTTLDGGQVPPEEIEAVKREGIDPRRFAQEWLATFETLSGRVYSNFDRHLDIDSSVTDTGAEIFVGQDFNVNPMASVIAVRVADECHVLDSLELPVSNTAEVATEIKARYPDRTVIFCPDPTGRRRITSAPVGQTDFTILQRAGFKVRAPQKAPNVVDRENNTQANLFSADGRRRIKIHPRAKALIRGLDGLTYKEGTSQRDKSGNLDHICDAFDYLLWQEFNLMQNREITVERWAR